MRSCCGPQSGTWTPSSPPPGGTSASGGEDRIGLRVGKVLNRFKGGKHFDLAIRDEGFSYPRSAEHLREEAALEGLYVIRTHVPEAVMNAQETVAADKGRAVVEQAFAQAHRAQGAPPLPPPRAPGRRPSLAGHAGLLCRVVRSTCVLAPVLFDEADPLSTQAACRSIVSPAQGEPQMHGGWPAGA